jgi:hypothetical protein
MVIWPEYGRKGTITHSNSKNYVPVTFTSYYVTRSPTKYTERDVLKDLWVRLKTTRRTGCRKKMTVFWGIAACSLVEVDHVVHTASIIALMIEAVCTFESWSTSRDYTVVYPRRLLSSYSPPWEPETSHGYRKYRKMKYQKSTRTQIKREKRFWISGEKKGRPCGLHFMGQNQAVDPNSTYLIVAKL